jgi:hypothetical protein
MYQSREITKMAATTITAELAENAEFLKNDVQILRALRAPRCPSFA